MMVTYNPDVFNVRDIPAAMKIILTAGQKIEFPALGRRFADPIIHCPLLH